MAAPMTMQEKVAQAIYSHIYTGSEDNPIMRAMARQIARVAIEAMKEPTDKMLVAGSSQLPDMCEDAASDVWSAMLYSELSLPG